jgi:hypothetical protein
MSLPMIEQPLTVSMPKNFKKKSFHVVFLTCNSTNFPVIKINFSVPISYKEYFCLTKLIHSTFINFQINSFSEYSLLSLFIVRSADSYEFELFTNYNDFKNFLTQIKSKANSRFKLLKDFNSIADLDHNIRFIEMLATTDSKYIESSIRQIKSLYIRKKTVYFKRFFSDNSLIFNVEDLISFFIDTLKKRWLLIPQLSI